MSVSRRTKSKAKSGGKSAAPEKKRGRGRPEKQTAEKFKTLTLTIPLAVAMVSEIDEYVKDASKQKFREVSRTEGIRDLLGYALRSWRKKQKDTDSDPSLF